MHSLVEIGVSFMNYVLNFKKASKAIFAIAPGLRAYLGAKTREVFLCFLAFIFPCSIVLSSQWLLCIDCFTSLVSFTGFYAEDEPNLN